MGFGGEDRGAGFRGFGRCWGGVGWGCWVSSLIGRC